MIYILIRALAEPSKHLMPHLQGDMIDIYDRPTIFPPRLLPPKWIQIAITNESDPQKLKAYIQEQRTGAGIIIKHRKYAISLRVIMDALNNNGTVKMTRQRFLNSVFSR